MLDDRPDRRIVERHDRDAFLVDVLPDVELGPVREREYPDRFALVFPGIVEVPEFGALALRVPAMAGRTEGEDPLLGAAFLLVAARAAESHVEAVMVERRLQRLGLHDVGIGAAVVEGVDPAGQPIPIDPFVQLETELLHPPVPEGDHLAELPGGIDMEQREGRFARCEGLHRQMQHDGAVLSDGIEHHGRLGLGRDFPHDVDAFGFEPLQMRHGGQDLGGSGDGIRHSCLPKIGLR
jgi:hypothetical protein